MMQTYRRLLADKRWFILGWSLGFAAIAALMIAMFPAMSESMDEIAQSVPPQLQGLMGDLASFSQYDNYIAVQFYDIRVVLLLLILVLILSVSLSVATEEKGVLRTILSSPVSRLRLYVETWLAGLTIIGAILLTLGVVTMISSLVVGELLSLSFIAKLSASVGLVAVALYSLVLGVGFGTGRRSYTLLIGIFVAIGSYVLASVGRGVEWLDSLERFSLLHFNDTASIPQSGFDPLNVSILLLIIVGSFVTGLLVFRQRDIN